MSKRTQFRYGDFLEVISTLDPDRSELFFDDCPLCQELKRKLEKGEAVLTETESEPPVSWN